MRQRIARAALCEAGFPELAEHVMVNDSEWPASAWHQTIKPTFDRCAATIRAFDLAHTAFPCESMAVIGAWDHNITIERIQAFFQQVSWSGIGST